MTAQEIADACLAKPDTSDYKGSAGIINIILENHVAYPGVVASCFDGDDDEAMEAFEELLDALVIAARAEALA